MKILDSAQMRNVDRRTTEGYGIPSIVLMENAALAVVDAVEHHFPEAGKIAVFCGTGNNGGDGLAAARHLFLRGAIPEVHLIGDRSKIAGDALANLEACDRLGIGITTIETLEDLKRDILAASRCDLVLDAIFGTGLDRPAEGLKADAIVAIGAMEIPIVAIDLPSGLDASSSAVRGPVLDAALTVTFAAPKIVHVFAPAADHCGEIVIADISIPEAAMEEEPVALSLITPDRVLPLVESRAAESHKGTYGHVAILGGSEGRSGAAILAARGAIRTGAGLVTVLTDDATARLVDAASTESMTFAIGRTTAALDRILDFVSSREVALIGPGLPDDEGAYEFVRELLPRIEVPLVIDASALNAYRGRIDALRLDGAVRILTPHPGELARLLDVGTEAILQDRIDAVRKAAERTGAVVVLKGNQTLVATPDGEVRVNPTGNAGMASGGMGDVLGGMIAALVGQGHDAAEAAAAAVWLHGFTGDLLAEETADIGLAARDLAEAIPRAIRNLRELAD